MGMRGQLLLVGTPLGNLGDMSPRGLEALRSCDFIAAEDTRVTAKLMTHFDIHKPMLSYFEHNKRRRSEEICVRLSAGETCALVTDAGMPAISDPGEELVAMCHARNIPVAAVPGPCAAVTAVALSGLPAGRFTFEGFLSVNRQSRRAHLADLAWERRTMVFYEAPHKLRRTLTDFLDTFGDRRIAVAREMTKRFEELRLTTLSQAIAYYGETTPKGEFVLVVEGCPKPAAPETSPEDGAMLARQYMESGMSASDAAKRAAFETGGKKGDIYRVLTAE